jgi:hypothetical protein
MEMGVYVASLKEIKMKTIDEEIRFHLSKMGWYLGETEIEMEDNINGVKVVTGALDSGSLAYYENGTIYISQAIIRHASLPQRRLVALHEYAHRFPAPEGMSQHDIEYACDKWALQNMINSDNYTVRELEDAIRVFGEIVDDEETPTHPSSKNRYKRLKRQLRKSHLREYV